MTAATEAATGRTGPDRTIARVRRAVLRGLLADLGFLLVSGLWLLAFYQPEAVAAWRGSGRTGGTTFAELVRAGHRLGAQVFIPVAVVAVALAVAEAIAPPGRVALRSLLARRRWASAAALVTGVVASLTGYLLPWDQLALWAVTVGTNMRGYGWVRDEDVRFALLGGAEVGAATMRTWLIVHMVVGLVALVLGGLSLRPPRRRTPEVPTVLAAVG